MEAILQRASFRLKKEWTIDEALYGTPLLTSCINIGRLSCCRGVVNGWASDLTATGKVDERQVE